jgi:hypothetical protein
LMRRIRRIGSISAPTFSSKPRMNAAHTHTHTWGNLEYNARVTRSREAALPGRVSEYLSKSSHRSSSLCSLANSIAYRKKKERKKKDRR